MAQAQDESVHVVLYPVLLFYIVLTFLTSAEDLYVGHLQHTKKKLQLSFGIWKYLTWAQMRHMRGLLITPDSSFIMGSFAAHRGSARAASAFYVTSIILRRAGSIASGRGGRVMRTSNWRSCARRSA